MVQPFSYSGHSFLDLLPRFFLGGSANMNARDRAAPMGKYDYPHSPQIGLTQFSL